MYKKIVSLVILYDSEKRILLQFRDSKAQTLPLHWGFFGGSIESGETPEQAVRRECFEELNYNMKNPKFVFAQEFKDVDHYGTKYVFIEMCNDKKALKLQEGQDWGWFKIEDTGDLKMCQHDKEVLEKLKDEIQGAK